MHLELETHWEVVSQNPFHDFARIDPAEDGREEDGAAALVESMLAQLGARPFVILT
jgi:hypothetical protein